MALQGGCMCGNVRYSVEGEPAMKALCHCADCRKISGGAYSVNGVFPEDGFKMLQGTTKQHKKVADSGKAITSHFCGDCGSTMWRDGDSFPGLKIVKVGTLDDANALEKLKPDTELFASVRVPWVAALDGAAQKETM